MTIRPRNLRGCDHWSDWMWNVRDPLTSASLKCKANPLHGARLSRPVVETLLDQADRTHEDRQGPFGSNPIGKGAEK